jgi:uncharacterized protein YaiE (UPF0345 family)
MTTSTFDNVSVAAKANVYFDGKCVSHSIVLADGTRKSVGVILPSTLEFTTGAPEVMETVAGECEVLLPGKREWQRITVGDSFSVPADSSFEIRVSGDAYHYICHFGE